MKLRAEQGASEGLWTRAEKQTGGIGRLGRKWESPEGNLYCSGLVDIRTGDPVASSLSFVAALAVFRVIRSHLQQVDMQLKWPNDILVSGTKVCGILLESVGDQIIVGIGINVAKAPSIEGRETISLHQAGAANCSASQLMDELAVTFSGMVQMWRTDGLPAIFSEWLSQAHPVGSPVSTTDQHGVKIAGTFDGLTADGALRLRKADGTLIEMRAGDIALG